MNVIKTNHAFRGCAISYQVELVEKNIQLTVWNKTKDFKYQITVKILLNRYKSNGEIEFAQVYFNSTKETVNHKFSLKNAFQEILYRIDNWINEGSGWTVELIKSQYINISDL